MASVADIQKEIDKLDESIAIQVTALKNAQERIGNVGNPIASNAVAGELKHTLNSLRSKRQKLRSKLR